MRIQGGGGRERKIQEGRREREEDMYRKEGGKEKRIQNGRRERQ